MLIVMFFDLFIQDVIWIYTTEITVTPSITTLLFFTNFMVFVIPLLMLWTKKSDYYTKKYDLSNHWSVV